MGANFREMSSSTRADKWLWATRFFKTRSLANHLFPALRSVTGSFRGLPRTIHPNHISRSAIAPVELTPFRISEVGADFHVINAAGDPMLI